MDWNGFVDDVLAVIDAWGVAPLVAVGHSKGGAALLLAEQRRPGHVRRPLLLRAGGHAGRRLPARSGETGDEPVGHERPPAA